MKTSETLNKAADLIEVHGWTQGSWGLAYNGDPVLPLCAEGAILAASGRGEEWWMATQVPSGSRVDSQSVVDSCPATQAVRGYLDLPMALCDWNDASTRTAAEVIEVLRAAAVIEQAREDAAAPAEVSL